LSHLHTSSVYLLPNSVASYTLILSQDEVFHIPQSLSYCRNDFHSYDPKLTTPAGLYLLSYPLSYFNICTTPYLRALNALAVALFLPITLYRLLQTLHGRSPQLSSSQAQAAINISLFPVLYFFSTLFYTDIYSTLFVLLAYLACLRGKPWISAIYCLTSLWFRQTNIIWTLFLAGLHGVSVLRTLNPTLHDPPLNSSSLQDMFTTPLSLLTTTIRNLPHFLTEEIPYLLVILSFLTFLISNDFTIVLGDKSAHKFTLHTTQLLYLLGAMLFFTFPLLLLHLLPLPLHLSPKTLLAALAGTGVMAAMVLKNTYIHPYLLADNRHYVFYLFRRLLLRFPPYTLLLPIPAYLTSLLLCHRAVAPSVTVSWGILFLFATAGTLVGAGLVEARYFLLPWLVWRVNVRERRGWVLAAEVAWYTVVNAGTLWMFLSRSFEWESDPGVAQRFMW
jgi:alpha-1,2-glucosyltransferase